MKSPLQSTSASGQRRSKVLLLSLLTFLTLFVPAMGPAAQQAESQNTLIVGLLSHPATLNPLVASTSQEKDIIERIFLKLLDEEDDFLNFKPRLAAGWEFSGDSLSITFKLREDVVWTDGTPCTAHDVRFTWELQIDSVIAWPSRHLKDRILDVEVIDDYTARFHFASRYPYQLMDANDGAIVPRHLLKNVSRDQFRTHPFGRGPVGNGPFMLGKWITDQYVELVRNPQYYEKGKPRLDRVVFRIVPDDLTLLTQLKAGEIDCLEAISSSAAAELENYKEIRIYRYPSRNLTYIGWNLQNDLFKERDIRRALTMAINREEIIQTLMNGMAVECKSPMSPLIWAYDPDIKAIPYNPERTEQVLFSHGWVDSDGDGIVEKDGRRFEFEMITNSGNQLRVDIMTMAEAYLRRVGVKVNINAFDFNHFISRVIQSDFESCVLGWKVGTRADLTELWHSRSMKPGGYNRVGYHNAEVDSLIDLAKNTMDPEAARELWSKCQRIIYGDQPFTFIALPYEVNALNGKFYGVEPSPISFFINLRDWYIGHANR